MNVEALSLLSYHPPLKREFGVSCCHGDYNPPRYPQVITVKNTVLRIEESEVILSASKVLP